MLSASAARTFLSLVRERMERLGTATWPVQPQGSGRALRERAEIQLEVRGNRQSGSDYCFGGSGIVLNPTRARYSSACSRSVPARSIIFSRLSIDETSSSCSVKNHCKKLIVM